jgi:hypothetical protein
MNKPEWNHRLSIFYFSLGDCTLNGISSPSRNRELEVVAFVKEEEKSKPHVLEFVRSCITERNKGQAVVVIERTLFGKRHDYIVAADDLLAGHWTMAGGNYAHTSDGRWSMALYDNPLPVHDRVENRAEKEALNNAREQNGGKLPV